jgi:uncharacterized protein YqgC (DUF456 family)
MSLAADAQVAWWIVAGMLALVGLAGTVLPAVPGAGLVAAAALIAAWADGFERVSGLTVGVIAALAVLTWAVDYVCALLGARRAGASPLALAGAAIGTVAGIFAGFVGLLFLPLAGAMAGEWWARRDTTRAAQVGLATWIGLLVGTAIKLALVFAMVGIFVVAWWV